MAWYGWHLSEEEQTGKHAEYLADLQGTHTQRLHGLHSGVHVAGIRLVLDAATGHIPATRVLEAGRGRVLEVRALDVGARGGQQLRVITRKKVSE